MLKFLCTNKLVMKNICVECNFTKKSQFVQGSHL